MTFLLAVTSALLQGSAEPAPAPERLLLRGGIVHSMKAGEEPRRVDLWIEDGRIRALGAAPWSGIDHAVLDVSGKHLVPGLIDAHVNFDPEHDALYLAAGITLVRDIGGDRSVLLRERLDESRDRTPGPFLLTAGAPLDGDPPAASQALVLRTPDAVDALLPILIEDTVDFVSILPGLSHEAFARVTALAHERRLTVFGPRLPRMALKEALTAGQDGFHGLDALLPPGLFWTGVGDAALDEGVAELARAAKPLVPLLYASASRLEDQALEPNALGLLGTLAPSYESWWRAELAQRQEFLTPERRAPGEALLARQVRTLRALFDAGGVLVPGSGAPQPWLFPGVALHRELAAWVRAGLTPAAALTAATRGAAAALGLAGQRGTLEPQAFADVLVLDGDPTLELAPLTDPAFVVVRGRALSRAELAARVAALGERQAGVRVALATPLEIAPPPQGEEGVVVLEGTVESETHGVRLSGERYRVVQLRPGVFLYTARVVFPASGSSAARELTLEQFVEDGRLAQVHVVLSENGSTLVHDGLWTAGTWRTQTRLDGQVIATPAPFSEQPMCVEAGSVTSLLILAQAPLDGSHPIVQLHPGFDPELVNWRTELDDNGDHQVRTNVGFRAFRLDAEGALEFGLTKQGAGLVRTKKLSSSAFGGAGLPLPESKRQARAASAPAGDAPR